MYYLQITIVALDSYQLLFYQYSCLVDFMVSSIQKSSKRKISILSSTPTVNLPLQ